MSKFATKAAANMFCQARYEAAKSNERLSSREGRNGSQERVTYRECILSGDSDIQNVSTGDVLKRAFALHCNGKVENKSTLTI